MPTYEPRTYRQQAAAPDLLSFRMVVEETDLAIQVSRDAGGDDGEGLDELERVARAAAVEARKAIQTEIALRPSFLTSLEPLTPRDGAPRVVSAMYAAAVRAGVGPMAAVAGAVAEHVGRRLLELRADLLVENGGDIFLSSRDPRTVAVQAGRSPLSGRIGLQIPGGQTLGICTSSATVGPSYSAGKADAAMIAADDAAFADAMASALGNRVHDRGDVGAATEWACGVPGVRQALVVIGDVLGVMGEFEVTRL